MKFLACQNCSKKLLKANEFDCLSVKCRKCGIINNFQRVKNPILEAHEAHIIGDPRGQTLQQSTPAIYRAET